MSRLWFAKNGQWTAVALDGRDDYDDLAQLTLLHTRGNSGADGQWVAMADAGGSLRINGQALPQGLGLRVLRDRDAIQAIDESGQAGDDVVFYSTQSTPIVSPLPGEKAIACARCRLKIQPGTPSVRCPTCGALHHQSPAEELGCWLYHTTCAVCQRQATALDDREVWTPQEL